MKTFSKEEKSQIQKNLMNWFQKNQRDLPWRKTYDPYAVWISEIMLQQTQVTTVLPYFKRWMEKLPAIRSVAEAKEEVVLKLWEGLGYYSRARNLQKAARMIMEQFDGRFPDRHDDILKLPGIGKYTAGAIISIAFNKPHPIVDGNVVRVLTRLLDFRKNTRLPENVKKCWQWAEELTSQKNARDFNQGLMELGALICKPQSPNCSNCPLRENCKAYEKKTVDRIPDRGEKIEKIPIKVAIAVIKKEGKIFIQKRQKKGLMGGLWEFPGGKIEKETPLKAIRREINEELGIEIKNIKKIRQIKHGYTKFSVDLHCYSADFDKGKIKLSSAIDGKWVKPEQLKKYPFPAANVKLIEDLI